MATLLSANLPANTEPVSASAGGVALFAPPVVLRRRSTGRHSTGRWQFRLPVRELILHHSFVIFVSFVCFLSIFACAQLLGWSRDIDYDSCVCTVTRSTAGADSVHHCYKSVGTTGGHN